MENMEHLGQLDQQIAELQSRRQAILDSQRALALQEVKNLIRRFEFSAQELGTTQKTKPQAVVREARYANPANTAQTWAGGKGKRPGWVRQHLENGGQLEDLLIKR